MIYMVNKIEHILHNGVEERWCGKCKTFKTLESFGYSKSTWDNLRPTCKTCLHQQNIGYEPQLFAPNAKKFILELDGSVSGKRLPIEANYIGDEVEYKLHVCRSITGIY